MLIYKWHQFLTAYLFKCFWSAKTIMFFPRKDVVLVSFYADYDETERYKIAAEELGRKLKKWRIPFSFDKVNDLGGYRKNSLYKPQFIYDKFIKLNRTVIWIDCDTTPPSPEALYKIAKHPSPFCAISESGEEDKMMGGLLKFENENNSQMLLNLWRLYCNHASDNNIPELDHDALKHAVLPYFSIKSAIGYVKLNSKIVGFRTSLSFDKKIDRIHFETTQVRHSDRLYILKKIGLLQI